MSKIALLILISGTFLANSMPPKLAAVFGIIFMGWSFWEVWSDDEY